MSYTCTGAAGAGDLGLLATGIWQNTLGSPSDISALTISGWFCQDYVVGNVNALLSTCYSGSNAGSGSNWAICPDADAGTLGILGQMYVVSFYNQRVASAVGAGGTNLFTSAADGDRRWTRTSPAELMKVYKDMAKQATETLNYMVASYTQNSQGSRLPRSTDFVSFYPVYPLNYP